MLFHVKMDVAIPLGSDAAEIDRLKAMEKARSQELQKAGTWRHLWRVVGQYSNISIFDVKDAVELHNLLITLPLYPYMKVQVTALCRHPSSIRDDDR